MKKWRGIKTTQIHKNENFAKTIINRLGQKSISLPRIDDKKRWAGYPSLAGTARVIAQLIPKCYYYVEPFAGTVKVYQMLSKEKYKRAVLNDKSKFIYKWLQKEFKPYIITKDDFIDCILRWDSKKTFYLIDPVWNKSYYDQKFSHFDRESVTEYNEDVLEFLENLKGKFIITTRKENKLMLNSKYNNYLVKSEYVLCGKYPKVLLTTNLKLKKLKQI